MPYSIHFLCYLLWWFKLPSWCSGSILRILSIRGNIRCFGRVLYDRILDSRSIWNSRYIMDMIRIIILVKLIFWRNCWVNWSVIIIRRGIRALCRYVLFFLLNILILIYLLCLCLNIRRWLKVAWNSCLVLSFSWRLVFYLSLIVLIWYIRLILFTLFINNVHLAL